MHQLYTAVFEPGFFSSEPVRVALGVGAMVAIVSALVGVFTVIRGQSFGGHALTDVATAGGSGALLVGMSPLSGFVLGGVLGAGAMEMIGVRRARGRDLATGIVLGAATGVAALFLYLDTTSGATTGATQQILFGSIFVIDGSTVHYVEGFGSLALVLLGFIYRPLLLSSINTDIARARGISVRLVGTLYMLVLALSVGLSSLAIGTILSTALLIGPAAAALRLTKRMGWTLAVAASIGVGATWIGVLLAYDSYYWGSSGNGWPVSFFIVGLVFLAYLASGLPVVRAVTGRRMPSDLNVPVVER
ncbi:MAG: cation transporter permease [Acidimicrobiaceae bacterium]|jgi:zinc/manganese transport system permease protein|nr:cation transporter permease [Acidimicrobiaceae bacterium]